MLPIGCRIVPRLGRGQKPHSQAIPRNSIDQRRSSSSLPVPFGMIATYPNPWHTLLLAAAGWMNREQGQVVEYPKAENGSLRELVGRKRPSLSDDLCRPLAVRGKSLGRKLLSTYCGIMTPDTILRWHRKLIAKKYDRSANRGPGKGPRHNEL